MKLIHSITYLKTDILKITLLSCIASIFDLFGISVLYPYFLIIFEQLSDSGWYVDYYQNVTNAYPIFKDKYIISIIVISIIITSYIVRHIIQRRLINFGHNMGLDMTHAVACYLLYEDYSKIKVIPKSKAIAILSAKINTSVYNVIIPIALLISAASFISFTIIVCLIINVWLTLTVIIVGVSTYSLMFLSVKLQLKKISETLNRYIDLKLGSLNEIVSSMINIRLYKMQRSVLKDFISIDAKLRSNQANLQFINTISRIQIEVMLIILGVVALLVMAGSSIDSDVVFIQLSMILIITQKLISYSQQIYNNLILVKGNMKDFSEVISLASTGKNHKKIKNAELPPKVIFDSLIVRNLSYAVDHTKPILESINLEIKKGDKIAIVGASGSGKSTLLNLLLGLYKPTSGSVFLNDGQENILSLGMVTSILTQDIYLNAGNLGQIISRYADNDDLKEHLLKTYLTEWSSQSSDEINITEGGENTSGGQRQRIALCQALARNPQVLFIDEGTSSLDIANQNNMIGQLVSNTDLTLISVTHRFETLKHFDKIFELKSGKLKKINLKNLKREVS